MKALALVDEPDHVCSRYRVRAFEPALERSGVSLIVEGLAAGTLARMRQFRRASAFDVVLLQRKLLSGLQWSLLRSAARRIVFDFDDAVMLRDSYDRRGFDDPKKARRFAAIMRSADLVVAGNDHLFELAARSGATGRVVVIPTCVDPRAYCGAVGSGRIDGIDLVWVGSSSTLQGLERESGLLDRLHREIPGLRLRLIADRSATLGGLEIVPVSWSEKTEAEEISRGDVGISLVPDDPWSRGKCGLKLLQYQAASLPVVANPVGVQASMVEMGVSGFLASSQDDWVNAVRTLASDPSLRRRLGRAGRDSVALRYDVDRWAPKFVAAIAGSAARTLRPVGRLSPIAASKGVR